MKAVQKLSEKLKVRIPWWSAFEVKFKAFSAIIITTCSTFGVVIFLTATLGGFFCVFTMSGVGN